LKIKLKSVLKLIDLIYFDPSGNGFSIPNGFQYAYQGKYYKVKLLSSIINK